MRLFAESVAWQDMIRKSKTKSKMLCLDRLISSEDPKAVRVGTEMSMLLLEKVPGL
jgi:hypothetical protein